jgi:hypothetical protein
MYQFVSELCFRDESIYNGHGRCSIPDGAPLKTFIAIVLAASVAAAAAQPVDELPAVATDQQARIRADIADQQAAISVAVADQRAEIQDQGRANATTRAKIRALREALRATRATLHH